jgi:hypothetical protein
VLNLVLESFTQSDIVNLAIGESPIENSSNKLNLIPSTPVLFPKNNSGDAPYSVDENSLRSVIYIPPKFTYGNVPLLLFNPGTGTTAGQNFVPNLGNCSQVLTMQIQSVSALLQISWQIFKLASSLTFTHGLKLNWRPGSEYVVYAIKYVSAISGNSNVSMLCPGLLVLSTANRQ